MGLKSSRGLKMRCRVVRKRIKGSLEGNVISKVEEEIPTQVTTDQYFDLVYIPTKLEMDISTISQPRGMDELRFYARYKYRGLIWLNWVTGWVNQVKEPRSTKIRLGLQRFNGTRQVEKITLQGFLSGMDQICKVLERARKSMNSF